MSMYSHPMKKELEVATNTILEWSKDEVDKDLLEDYLESLIVIAISKGFDSGYERADRFHKAKNIETKSLLQ